MLAVLLGDGLFPLLWWGVVSRELAGDTRLAERTSLIKTSSRHLRPPWLSCVKKGTRRFPSRRHLYTLVGAFLLENRSCLFCRETSGSRDRCETLGCSPRIAILAKRGSDIQGGNSAGVSDHFAVAGLSTFL